MKTHASHLAARIPTTRRCNFSQLRNGTAPDFCRSELRSQDFVARVTQVLVPQSTSGFLSRRVGARTSAKIVLNGRA